MRRILKIFLDFPGTEEVDHVEGLVEFCIPDEIRSRGTNLCSKVRDQCFNLCGQGRDSLPSSENKSTSRCTLLLIFQTVRNEMTRQSGGAAARTKSKIRVWNTMAAGPLLSSAAREPSSTQAQSNNAQWPNQSNEEDNPRR